MCVQCPKSVIAEGYIALFTPCPNPHCKETEAARIKQEKALKELLDWAHKNKERIA